MKYPLVKPVLPKEAFDNLKECYDTGWISSKGNFVERVEIQLGAKLERDYALATSSGTTALHLALKALDIGPGDEVIVPDLTFIAPVNAILHCGATPILIDSHPSYLTINQEKIKERITSKTKAILMVHLYGIPCNVGIIKNFCDNYGLWLIEDAAEALGGYYDDKPIGSFGDISILSFFANKNITSGEGGMILTNHEELKDIIQSLRDHGTDPRCPHYYHPMLGYNYRMTNLQAAVLEPQIKLLPKIIEAKKEIFHWYTDHLRRFVLDVPPIALFGAEMGYWLYFCLVEDQQGIMKHLGEKGIESRPFFKPAHSMPYISNSSSNNEAVRLSKQGINLPTYVGMTEEDVKIISTELSTK